MFCVQCSHSNADDASFCASCGSATVVPERSAADARTVESAPLELYRACVGHKNQGYYLSRFARYLKSGRSGVSWNWAAFFLTWCWFLYRKMWMNAAIYFFAPPVIVLTLGAIVAHLTNSSEGALSLFYYSWAALLWTVPPMFANALYFRHCRNKIDEVTAVSDSRDRQLGELSVRGGTSNIAVILVGGFAIVAMIGIVAAVAVPAYQVYTVKAELASAQAFGMKAANSVADYFNEHEELPPNLEAAGFSAPLPESVRELSYDPGDGTIAMQVASAPPAVDGKRLLIVPSLDENNNLEWSCLSREIETRYLPPQCRERVTPE